jgi:hypothetical protein
MCSHGVSLQYVSECVGFDALIDGMPCHKVDTCRAEEAQGVHLALHLAEKGYQGGGGESLFPFDDFDPRETFAEISMTVEEEIGEEERRGRKYCWSQAVACD